MVNEQKDLAVQSYEKKIVTTLREEKYELNSLKRNKDFLDHLDISGQNAISLANKFYKEQINKVLESYKQAFNDIVAPLVFEKGVTFDPPEEELKECFDKYDFNLNRVIEKIQICNKIHQEPFFDIVTVADNWGLCLDGIENFPLMLALGVNRIIILDEKFDLNLHFFAALGAMPDIKPISKAGNIDMPPDSYSINLQIMLGTTFKKVSILLLKQKLENLEEFFSFMVNIGLVVDTKYNIDEDFSGLKWVRNSLKHSLFKNKYFLNIAKVMKVGGLIIDKSVSPMQVQKIQTLNSSNLNFNVGFDIYKVGTLQYSIIQKKENSPIAFDTFENTICRIPEFTNKASGNNTFNTF